MKRIIAYLNVATLAETDITVLRELSYKFAVHWFVIYEPTKNSSLSIDSIKQFANDNNINLHIHMRDFRIRSLKNWRYYKKLYDDVISITPSLIYHCNVEFYWAFFFLFNTKIKVVMGLHDVDPHSSRKGVSFTIKKINNFFVRKVFPNNIVFSKNQKDLYERIYHRPVVNVGMSCKDFGRPTNNSAKFNKSIKLLFFGSIAYYKGLDILISTLEVLFSEGFDRFSLTIAGKGNDSDWQNFYLPLIKTTSNYNIQYRFIDSDEIPNLFNEHHFLILPYRDATQSGPVLIAANYCIPIIAPDFGCFSDTYDYNSAILYSVNDLTNALRALSQMDESHYNEMKRNCLKIKDKFSEKVIAQNYINYFNRVICGK